MTTSEMPYSDLPENLRLGETLSAQCRHLDVTVKSIVAKTDIDPQQVYYLFSGKAVSFERCFARVAKIAQVMGVDLGELVNRVVKDT